MAAKENQRVALTKRLLQEGLLRLLDQKELSKINVTELCRESGINRATFYKHYGCPEDVLVAVKEQFFQELLESQQQGHNENTPVAYFDAFGRTCAYIYENREFAIHIIKNLNFDISDILKKLSHEQNGIYEYLERTFDSEDAELASTFIGYGMYSIVRSWLLEDISKTPKEMEAIIHKLLNAELFQ